MRTPTICRARSARTSTWLLTSLLTIAGLGLGACGGGGDGGDDASPGGQSQATSTAATSPQASPGAQATPTATSAAVLATATRPPGATTTKKACDLMTKDEATTALGEAVGDGTPFVIESTAVLPGLTVNISTCTFNSATSARSVGLTIWVAPANAANQLRQAMDAIVCAQKERVSGLGDSGCWYDSDHNELQLVKGSVFLDFQVVQLTGPDRTEALKTLAAKALGRLP